MKRKDLIAYLLKNGCVFLREGARHTILYNTLYSRTSSIPRHTEIHSFLGRKICRDLGVPEYSGR